MDYKQILEDILELDERITIIRGFGDVIKSKQYQSSMSGLLNLKEDNFWIILGRGDHKLIIESFEDYEIPIDMEGEYEFKAVLKYLPGEYDEYGRCTMRDYLGVEYIEFNFIQTFQQRERQQKLDEILSKDLEDLFKF
jgi:hypothetical protein